MRDSPLQSRFRTLPDTWIHRGVQQRVQRCIQSRDRTPSRTEAAQSRSEATHRALKRQLLLGEFPFGHRLGEERLAAMLEVSRTPVREALARLHAEGHVQRHPEGGFEPAFPDMDRIAELYEVRKSLELTAVRRTVGRRQRRR